MIERGLPRPRPVAPEDLAVAVDDHRRPGARVVGEEDPLARQRLRVGRVRDRRLHGPAQPAARGDVVDPRPLDLRDEDAAVRERRVAVDRAEVLRRIVPAHPGRADLPHDPVRADEEDAAVVRVGDGQRPVWEHVRVVGRVQLVRAAAAHAGRPVQVRARMRADVHRDDRVRLLLVRDDRLSARLDEAVVVEIQVNATRAVAGGWERPQHTMMRVDEEHAIVPAVGNEE